jgi:hypothetical protein
VRTLVLADYGRHRQGAERPLVGETVERETPECLAQLLGFAG